MPFCCSLFLSVATSQGDIEQDLNDAPASQTCNVEEKCDTARKGDREAAQNNTEDSGEEEKPSPESGQKNAGEASPQDSLISDMEKSPELDKNTEKPSGISQEECDEGKQTEEEAESKPTPHNTDNSDADDEPLVRTCSNYICYDNCVSCLMYSNSVLMLRVHGSGG